MDPEPVGSELYRQYDVLVCTGELLFGGRLSCNFSQRLIDALNEGVSEEPRSRTRDFLSLADVTITDLKGGTKAAPRLHISKNSIVFVAQASCVSPGKPLTGYPFRQKLSATVMAYASGAAAKPYRINGCIYIDTWGQITDTLETEERFLPLTQAEIDPPLPGNLSHFDFVALNKERIISIGQVPGN
jgi:hypothetical protein